MAPVTIVPPNATWAVEFRAFADGLRAALGPLALRVDHIGSTSVPGLAAKDILDVQVTVAALDAEGLAEALERAGLVRRGRHATDHRPPGATGPASDWQKLFCEPASGRAAHVHVRVAGRPNQRFALLCRDYLRTHPDAATAYAEFKARLAALGIDSAVYADIKDPVFDLIVEAAEAWAILTNWHPGPSDA